MYIVVAVAYNRSPPDMGDCGATAGAVLYRFTVEGSFVFRRDFACVPSVFQGFTWRC